MKINMAESDYFNVGSIVACNTCYGQKIQGEVVAFDHTTKMLVLKSPSGPGRQGLYDMRMLNLNMVSEIDLIKECSDPPSTLTNLNFNKLQQRVRATSEEKRRKVKYVGIGVTPEGQKLFNAITKTINDVHWENQKIIVMDQVVILPPYGLENCKPINQAQEKAAQHVKKIIEKHIRDQESASSSTTSSQPSSSSPSPSPQSNRSPEQ
ncbi:protein LSM12 homolog A-like [Lingula anatina]|uniref:Protein LSM12 homolog A n=1 Tax=Lingula anatina TaxID=7574 RepID=A0A1S3IPE6_LINAN|nr:protein LSM12 homolog A [Lingula anatina]XP_013407714.1 protein LSM12 homolog A-like [Lingula anatina]|eukprot:XP_013399948.1 protein LSM12 homolog A [Lingula anatina]